MYIKNEDRSWRDLLESSRSKDVIVSYRLTGLASRKLELEHNLYALLIFKT